jgi:hypothetical protein
MGVAIDGVWNGFIDHLHTWLGNTNNYSTTGNLHNSQITTVPAKSSQPAVFTSLSLATASNSGGSSASCAQGLSSQPPVQTSALN